MPDYEKMYFELMAKVSDAIDILEKAQQAGEEAYMDDGEEEDEAGGPA